MYPDERVVRLVTTEFLPIRVHVRDPDGLYARVSERLNVHWTPTVLVLDETGVERHRIEGFVPTDDFLAQLKLGLAKSSLQRGAFDDAERRFRELVAEHPQSESAPEALYWAGVVEIQGAQRRECVDPDRPGLHDAGTRTRCGRRRRRYGGRRDRSLTLAFEIGSGSRRRRRQMPQLVRIAHHVQRPNHAALDLERRSLHRSLGSRPR